MVRLRDLRGPDDLKDLSHAEARALCTELREVIIDTVAVTGGHLGSSLGVVELTVALHRVLSSPTDKIVWDTGHQAYAHKLLTGRLDGFGTLRQLGGVGGFPRRSESVHDIMDGGHAGTGLSVAEGLALARDRRGGREHVAVVVGDAALMSGLSLEALNDIGQRKTRMVILLNDNEMSISPTVGAVSQYLSRIKLSPQWRDSRRTWDAMAASIPRRRTHRAGVVQEGAARRRRPVAAGSPLRGPGRHVRGARPRPRSAGPRPDPAPGAAGGGCADHRPRAHPEGLRIPPRGGGQGELPRGGPAAHARAGTVTDRRQRHDPGDGRRAGRGRADPGGP